MENKGLGREDVLREIKAIRVGPKQPLRQVVVPERVYDIARQFLKWAPNVVGSDSFRFKKLYFMPGNDSIYVLLMRDAGDTSLDEAKSKLGAWQEATKALLRYALNLLLAPKRPEFLRMKLSSSYYVYQVARKLKEAEKILICMGYELTKGTQELQELKYSGEVQIDQVAEVATDLVVLHSELELMKGLVQAAISDRYVNTLLCDILTARAKPSGEWTDALSATAQATHQRLLANVHPQVVAHHSPALTRHVSRSPHPQPGYDLGHGQQFHQSQTSQVVSQSGGHHDGSQMQRGRENVASGYGVPGTIPPRHIPEQQQQLLVHPQPHQHSNHPREESIYHNLSFGGQQAASGSVAQIPYNVKQPQVQATDPLYCNTSATLYPNIKSNYGGDGKMLEKGLSKGGRECSDKAPVNVNVPTAAVAAQSKANVPPYSPQKQKEQGRPAESQPPNPMDLPEPVFNENELSKPTYYEDTCHSGSLDYLIYSRSVQSEVSGPNLDSMLSSDRSLDFECAVCEKPSDDANTPVSEVCSKRASQTSLTLQTQGEVRQLSSQNDLDTPTNEEQFQPESEKPTNEAGRSPKPRPAPRQLKGAALEVNKVNDDKNKAVTHPVPKPRTKMPNDPKRPHTQPAETATGSQLTEQETLGVTDSETQSGESEYSKPHSSPHPSLESNSAHASMESGHGLPDSGPQSNEDPSTLSPVSGNFESIIPPPRERSNAINSTPPQAGKKLRQTSRGEITGTTHLSVESKDHSSSSSNLDRGGVRELSPTWKCEYCTNLVNSGATICDICGSEQTGTV